MEINRLKIFKKSLLERRLGRLKKYSRAIELMKEKCDSLVLSVKHHPLPWLFMLLKFIKPGRPFAVYCDRQEPLMGKR